MAPTSRRSTPCSLKGKANYDALYALADRLGVPLLTGDTRLSRAPDQAVGYLW
jgi:predicted nucleic acid-binding protein